jgi:hypothetical protein
MLSRDTDGYYAGALPSVNNKNTMKVWIIVDRSPPPFDVDVMGSTSVPSSTSSVRNANRSFSKERIGILIFFLT